MDEMSWVIGGVTLPIAPYKVECGNPADINEYRMPGNLPFILVWGRKSRTLRIEGFLYKKGWTKDQLEASYITSIEGYVGTVVGITAPGTRYDGDWVVTGFTYQEEKAQILTFTYRLDLAQGAAMIEITG